RFPPELRPARFPEAFRTGARTAWRFATPDRAVTFRDKFAGPQSHRPIDTIGDFAVWTTRDEPSYQLAVVVDDHRQGVTHVVRGDDLLDSAARQLLLYEALRFAPPPAYFHLPLVRGADGRRLAKRHGDTRVARYREEGVSPERVLGLLAYWSGQISRREPIALRGLLERFDLSTMARDPVIFTAED